MKKDLTREMGASEEHLKARLLLKYLAERKTTIFVKVDSI